MPKYLYVEVVYDPETPSITVNPDHLTLEADTEHVVWWCTTLPADGRLSLLFPGSQQGPFQSLSFQGNMVIGSGNLGASTGHPYQVRVGGQAEGLFGEGVIYSEAQRSSIIDGAHCDLRDPGPPVCY